MLVPACSSLSAPPTDLHLGVRLQDEARRKAELDHLREQDNLRKRAAATLLQRGLGQAFKYVCAVGHHTTLLSTWGLAHERVCMIHRTKMASEAGKKGKKGKIDR